MATQDELQRAVNNNAKVSEAAVELFVKDLEAILRKRMRTLSQELSGVDALETAIRLGGLYNSLEALGYKEQLARLEEIYAIELGSVREEFIIATGEDPITDIDIATLETLIDFDIEEIDNTVHVYTDRLKSIIQREAVFGNDFDVQDLHEELSPATFNRVKTELNTGAASFNRALTVRKARETGDKDPLYYYNGPLDKITRDFCEGILVDRSPPIYKESEILRMDNGQGLDPLMAGGGYNCRHKWSYVSKNLAGTFR